MIEKTSTWQELNPWPRLRGALLKAELKPVWPIVVKSVLEKQLLVGKIQLKAVNYYSKFAF